MKNDPLGDRMKNLESVPKTRLVPKLPVLGRLDGKAFHTFTRSMTRPYDERFHRCMWAAANHLCANIQGCQIAYIQSDEITLLLIDTQTYDTQAWFDYEVQKMCSVAAGMCSVAFYEAFMREFPDSRSKTLPSFDARFWNVPVHEVSNAFLWRQRDAERNSLTMQCQACYSHKELHGKSRAERHDLLHAKGINWNDLPTPLKRGVCVVRETYQKDGAQRARWAVDENIPIFSTPEGRLYIDRFVNPPTTETAPSS
jgi:tRNA(His) 5'-end guanylyltransferase